MVADSDRAGVLTPAAGTVPDRYTQVVRVLNQVLVLNLVVVLGFVSRTSASMTTSAMLDGE